MHSVFLDAVLTSIKCTKDTSGEIDLPNQQNSYNMQHASHLHFHQTVKKLIVYYCNLLFSVAVPEYITDIQWQ